MRKAKVLAIILAVVLLATGCGGTPSSQPSSSLEPSSVSSEPTLQPVQESEPEPESEESQLTDTSTVESTPMLYRVRKEWNDSKSQLGAFATLENAKTVADEKKAEGYKVFDESGNVIYEPTTASAESKASSPSDNSSLSASSSETLTNPVLELPKGMSSYQFKLLKQVVLEETKGLKVPEQNTDKRIAQDGELVYVGLRPVEIDAAWGVLIIRLLNDQLLTTYVYFDIAGTRYEYNSTNPTIAFYHIDRLDTHLPGLYPGPGNAGHNDNWRFVLGEYSGNSTDYTYKYTKFYPTTVNIQYMGEPLKYFYKQEVFENLPSWNMAAKWSTYFDSRQIDAVTFLEHGAGKTFVSGKEQLEEKRKKWSDLEFTTLVHYTGGEYEVQWNTKESLERVMSTFDEYLG